MQRYAKMIKGQNKTERYCVIFYLLMAIKFFKDYPLCRKL